MQLYIYGVQVICARQATDDDNIQPYVHKNCP